MKNIKSKVLASCCQNYVSSLNDNTNDNTIALMILNSVLKKSVVKKHHILKYTIINITELYHTLTWVPCNMLLTKIKTDSNVIFFMYLNAPSIIPSTIHSHLIQISLKHPI